MPTVSDSQATFDEKYISASQIIKDLKINRSTLHHARIRGLLPEPIIINQGKVFLWEREKIQAHLDAWRLMLSIRKSV